MAERRAFSFVIHDSVTHDCPLHERMRRMISELVDIPDCNIQLLQMVQISGERENVEHAYGLVSRSFSRSNHQHQNERIAGA